MLALEIIGAVLVGLTLGLLGAGGAIVTVPILVYLVGEDPKSAVAESLLIVAIVALVAGIHYARGRLVDWGTALLLAVPGALGALLGSELATRVSGRTQMVLFAIVASYAALRMVTTPEPAEGAPSPKRPAWQPILAGIGIGIVTGLIGVGGGFLLIPTLVLLLGVPMRRAVATSLMVIAANSLVGFARHAVALRGSEHQIHYDVVLTFVALGVAGGILGTWLSPRIPQAKLRSAFAVLLVLAAAGIATKELWPRG